MHKSQVFLYFLLCILFGIGAASFTNTSPYILYTGFFIGSFLVLFWLFERDSWKVGVVGICLLAFVAGIVRYSIYTQDSGGTYVREFNGSDVVLIGVIDSEPDMRAKNTRLIVDVSRVRQEEYIKDVSGYVLVFVERYPEFLYGDKIQVTGTLEEPEQLDDFDYPAYLSKDEIYSLLFYPEEIQLISSGNGNRIYSALFFLKRTLEKGIESVFPEPEAALLKGLLLGSRSGLPQWLLDAFRAVGVIHIIALSGFNITIITDNLSRTFKWFSLGPRLVFWVSLAIISLFVILVGASASIVRAAIMGMLVLLARKEGRIYGASIALICAATIMVFHNPKILRFDMAFQLSVLATLGLILFSSQIEVYLRKIPEFMGLRGNFAATLSAQAMVLPLLVYRFGEVSLISPLANLLVLSVIPITMFFGFAAVLISFFSQILGVIIAGGAHIFLMYEIGAVEVLSSVPYAWIYTGTGVGMVLFTMLPAIFLFFKTRK